MSTEYRLSYTAAEIDERLGKVDNLVSSVNGVMPDINGNVEITIPDSGGNVDLTGYATEQFVRDGYQPKGSYLTAVPEGYAKTEDIPKNVVKSVNGQTPDENGNVPLKAENLGAVPSTGGEMTGELRMNGQPISGLNVPTANDQAANMGFVNQQVKKAAPRNLLDNSDFTNPVNQRGLTSYTGGYGIDRWVLQNSNGKMTVEDGCVSFEGVSGSIYPRQYLPIKDYAGKSYTGAVTLDDGSVHVFGGGIAPSISEITKNTAIGEYANITSGTTVALFLFTNGYLTVQVSANQGHSIKIKNVALYEGLYTTETIPAYQPKGYAAELAECQRYFYRIRANWKWIASGICTSATVAMIPIKLPQGMRINPTVTIPDSSKIKIKCGSIAAQVPTAIAWNFANDCFDIIQMESTVSGATTGTVAVLYFDNGGIIEFSANL